MFEPALNLRVPDGSSAFPRADSDACCHGTMLQLSPFEKLRRKAASRISRHWALERRRLKSARPMVSFTFDDVAESAYGLAAPLIETTGARATFYVSTALLGKIGAHYRFLDANSVAELHRRGHEIGLHGHAHVSFAGLSEQSIVFDIRANRDGLQSLCHGAEPENFAYPYGEVSWAAKRTLSRLTRSCRTVTPGVQSGVIDPSYLRSVELADARLAPATLDKYLDRAVERTGWLIFCLHDVSDSPSPYGCTPTLLGRALVGAAARKLEIVTVRQGLMRSE